MNRTILLIEDNDQNRYLATFLLEAHDYRVISTPSGREGIELAKSAAPVLILLDIQLPGMDGYAVARALRADPATAAIPIVAVTSHAMVGDRETALAAGCDGYVEKPIDPDTFVDEIRRFMPAGS